MVQLYQPKLFIFKLDLNEKWMMLKKINLNWNYTVSKTSGNVALTVGQKQCNYQRFWSRHIRIRWLPDYYLANPNDLGETDCHFYERIKKFEAEGWSNGVKSEHCCGSFCDKTECVSKMDWDNEFCRKCVKTTEEVAGVFNWTQQEIEINKRYQETLKNNCA